MVNDELLSASVRYQIHLIRYGRGLTGKIVKLLADADKALVERIAVATIDSLTEKRLQALLKELREISDGAYGKAADVLQADLKALAVSAANTQAATFQSIIGLTKMAVPSPTLLETIATSNPIQGRLLKSWTRDLPASRLVKIEQVIRTGMVSGASNAQMIREIRGTKAAGFADGLLGKSRQSIQTLVLTATSTVATEARVKVCQANPGVIRGFMVSATLDGRTTPLCQSLDGKVYALDEKFAKPPYHPRCRTVLVPVTYSYDELGINKKEIPKGNRASMNGQVPGGTTYREWLSKQPQSFQEKVLGKERARLVREGKLKLEDAYRDDGSYRSLAELEKMLAD